jgi:soluble P-type ATPase
MIAIEIPGWGNLDIENVVFDLNGTLAKDGKILPGVQEKINSLSAKVKIYILTADTQGTADEEAQGLKAELVRVSGNDSKNAKLEFLHRLRPEATVAIGNGNNDQLILKESALGIAVLEREGMSWAAMKNADLAVREISDAFDLLLEAPRLIATLRE